MLFNSTLLCLSSYRRCCSPFSCSPIIGHFSTTFSCSRSHSVSLHHYDYEESRNIKVSVWWDFENCNVPVGANVFKVAHVITSAVRVNGIKGPVHITAFGDVLQLSRTNQEALSSTGITIAHVPNGGKNSADRSLLMDLMCWVSQNPAPVHLFLISGDRDFSSILHRLRMNNYNILLASTESVPSVLCSAASIMWNWNSLVRGDDLSGRHFNHPPDGSYGSWYGRFKMPLEDPFSLEQAQPPCSPTEEISAASSESKIRPVPEAVTNQIRHILRSNPEGISVSELRTELGRTGAGLDRELYGYKKFSRFLSSMPHILKLQISGGGQSAVYAVPTAPEPSDPTQSISMALAATNSTQNLPPPSDGKMGSNSSCSTEGHFLTPQSVRKNTGEEQQMKMKQSPVEKKSEDCTSAVEEQVSPSPPPWSIAKKIGGFWLRMNDSFSNVKCTYSHDEGKSETSLEQHDRGIEMKEEKMCAKLGIQNGDQTRDLGPSTARSKQGRNDGFFNLILRRLKVIWRGANLESQGCRPSEFLEQVNVDPEKPNKIFFEDCFWRDMEFFVVSPRGLLVISKSRSRDHLAQNLQQEGPLCLKSLTKSELLELVRMLIKDKKWLTEEESPSSAATFPFSLSNLVKKDAAMDVSPASVGLRSIFSRTPPNPHPKEPSYYSRKPSEKCRDHIAWKPSLPDPWGRHKGKITGPKPIQPTGNLSEASKVDDSDLLWEELGPVENAMSASMRRPMEEMPGGYEPPSSDDELSESEGESSAASRSAGQLKPVMNEESSLLQILNSWHASRDGSGRKNVAESVLRPSDQSVLDRRIGTGFEISGRKQQRAQKSYSSMAGSCEDDKGRQE